MEIHCFTVNEHQNISIAGLNCAAAYTKRMKIFAYVTELLHCLNCHNNHKVTMENEIVDLNILFVNLNNIFQVLFTIYIPTINAAFEEAVHQINDDRQLNMLVSNLGSLFQAFYQLIALVATCTHSSLPRPRIQNVLFPEFLCSEFPARDVFSELERCEHLFWSLTGESVESFRRIVQDVGPVMSMYTRQRQPRVRNSTFKLNEMNRILLLIIWLKMYPEISMLSALFMVSPTTIEREIRFLLPMLWTYFRNLVQWPTPEQWMEMRNNWEHFPGGVAAIDGTRHEIQRPQTEPQQQFYSGHCRYHNFSTQIVMDNRGSIVFIQSGFLGHNNDSAQLQMMPRIGNGEELHLPAGLYILADKGYPCEYPFLTPWRERDVARDERRKLFNLELRRMRVRIEHCIRRVKEYGAVNQLWRHERWMFPVVNELCAFLAQRHINLSRVI